MISKIKSPYVKIYLVIGFCYVICGAFAQVNEAFEQLKNAVPIVLPEYGLPYTKRKKVDIQEVSLRDTILINEIKKLIKEETEQSEMFRKGWGYIYVYTNANEYLFYDTVVSKNVRRCYYINVSWVGLKSMKRQEKAYSYYPNFYTFVDGKLVFIKLPILEDMVCQAYTEKSMRRLRKIQNKFLEKTKHSTFHDMDGKKVFTDRHFRIDYHKLHGGKYIYIYRDQSYEVKQDPFKND